MAKVRTDDPGFKALLLSQALGAFNDNAFKTFLALLAVSMLPAGSASRVIAGVGAIFILPFILFSAMGGALADRYDKKRLIVLLKAVEVGLMALALPALWFRNVPALAALLFLMGIHSALFGPVKLSILPELLDDKDLSHGNGLTHLYSFSGIMLGTVAAGLLAARLSAAPHAAVLLFLAVAAAGLAVSLRIPGAPAREPGPLPGLNFVSEALASVRAMRRHYGVYMATVGAAYFWFLGALFQMNMLVYGKDSMGGGEGLLTWFQIVATLGIGAGSYAGGRLSRQRVELGLVPLAALGLAVFALDLAFAYRSPARTFADLFLFGACGGCFVVPLQAFIQQRSPEAERGRYIAAGNLLSFAAILVASAALWAFDRVFGLRPGEIFVVASVMTMAVAAAIVKLLPDSFIRLVIYPLANGVYRITADGAQNVPLSGPALLVANHVSFVDAFLIGGASPRPVRFLMHKSYYDAPGLHWFCKVMGAIPISGSSSPRAIVESLNKARSAIEAGQAVCIFAEGQITRHGQMLKFKKGFERIVGGLPVPIIPVHLDRVWGSIFSFEGGKVFFKRPRRLPYPVTVSFGRPMPSSASAHDVRQAILDVGTEAFRHRLAEKEPLPVAFARQARRSWFSFALADTTGARLTRGSALARALALGRALERALPPEGEGSRPGLAAPGVRGDPATSREGDLPPGRAVGVLLPPSVAGAVVNAALSLSGRVPVNLNYTASRDIAVECCRRAGAKAVVTSRKVLQKLGWEPWDGVLFVEDVAASIPKARAAASAALAFLLPWPLFSRVFLGRWTGPGRRTLDDLATVMFTSGSTGVPKGVMLTHANIMSNIEAFSQVFAVGPSDRIAGVLPFFHSFGFTVTLWFPLTSGAAAAYHHSPLDARAVGDLVEKNRATMLVGTPTFMNLYVRKVPAEKFRTLKFAVIGAEKLREDLARAFREKFGLAPLEGYGCTELSPVASVNIPDSDPSVGVQTGTKPGTVGHPLPGVVVKVVDPDTGAELQPGRPGLLLVKGPNVMRGYLDDPARTAEAMREGYYVTGDIAALDEDGYVTLTDRLSRFSKIGGEMVPHVRVEEKLHELAGAVDQAFVVTAVPDPSRGERLVVLCKRPEPGAAVGGLAGSLDELHKALLSSDMPRLWLPEKASFHEVESFPLLGSGKLDLARLKALARELHEGGD